MISCQAPTAGPNLHPAAKSSAFADRNALYKCNRQWWRVCKQWRDGAEGLGRYLGLAADDGSH